MSQVLRQIAFLMAWCSILAPTCWALDVSVVVDPKVTCNDCSCEGTAHASQSCAIGPLTVVYAWTPISGENKATIVFTNNTTEGEHVEGCYVTVYSEYGVENGYGEDTYTVKAHPVIAFDDPGKDEEYRFSAGDKIIARVTNADGNNYVWEGEVSYKYRPAHCDTLVSVTNILRSQNTTSFSYTVPNLPGICMGTLSLTCYLNPPGSCCASDPLYAHFGCEDCTCGSCNKSNIRNSSVDAEFPLGSTLFGAGSLCLYATEPSPDLYQPISLKLMGDSSAIAKVWQNGALRQVDAPECQVDIVTEGNKGFRMDYYVPGAFSALSNGVYLIATNRTPYLTYVVTNPAAWSDYDTIRIEEHRVIGSAVTNIINVYSFDICDYFIVDELDTSIVTHIYTNTLTLQKPGQAWEVKSCWSNSNEQGWWTEKRIGVGTETGSVVRTWEYIDESNRTVAETVHDPEGLAVTEHAVYDAEGRLLSQQNRDGTWAIYEYDEFGRTAKVIEPMGDVEFANYSEANCKVREYSYTPIGGTGDTNGICPYAPRTVTEKVVNNTVGSTFHVYERANGVAERLEITERGASPTATFGSEDNLRTVSYYSTETGKLLREVGPDGRTTYYNEERGDFDWEANPGAGTFTSCAGTWECDTVISGTDENGDFVSGHTLKDVTIMNFAGWPFQTEQHVFTGGTNWERIAWTWNVFNDLGQIVETRKHNGMVSEAAWGCCGKEWEKDDIGIQKTYSYNDLRQVIQVEQWGEVEDVYPAQVARYTLLTYDAADREISRTRMADTLSLTSSKAYDAVGRVVSEWDEAGLQTMIEYSTDGLSETNTLPSGGTIVSTHYRDGRPKSEIGPGQSERYYEYGVTDGSNWTKVSFSYGANPWRWEKTWQDALGRTTLIQKPGVGGAVEETANWYDNVGRLAKVTRTGLPDILYEYNNLGEQIRQAEDINGDGAIDLVGPDRVTGSGSRFEIWSGTVAGKSVGSGWFHVNESLVWPVDDSALCVTSSVNRQRLTGFASIVSEESVSEEADGMASVSWTETIRENNLVRSYTLSAASTCSAMQVSFNGLAVESRSSQGMRNLMFYDGLGRQTIVQDSRGQERETHYDSQGRVDYTEDEADNRTSYGYDSAGRQNCVTDPLGHAIHSGYDVKGRLIARWGDTYPIYYEYDMFDELFCMSTIQNTNYVVDSMNYLGVHFDVCQRTQFRYDYATGLVTNKIFQDGTDVKYEYGVNGLLTKRIWARTADSQPLTTTYSYSNGLLTHITYSDTSTPQVVFTLDRMGRHVRAAVTGVCTSWYSFNPSGQLTVETNKLRGITLGRTRYYDSIGRMQGIKLGDGYYEVRYGFDTLGRLSSVTSSLDWATRTFNMDWDDANGMLEGWSSGNFSVTRGYEAQRPLLAFVENKFGSTVISRYDYTTDIGGRRTVAALSGTAFGDMGTTSFGYGYNSRGELTSAQRAFGSDPEGDPVAEQAYRYTFDQIGNRIESTLGDEGRVMTYTPNGVNQYTQRTVPKAFAVYGTASAGATVTVNGEETERQDAYYSAAVGASNQASAVYTQVVVEASENNIVSASTGRVFVAGTPEGFSYDADGNLTQDGRFQYTWDAENRLIRVETLSSMPAEVPRVMLTMSYDHLGRRVELNRFLKDGNGEWVLDRPLRYVYEGWNVVSEVRLTPGAYIIANIWGPDLSGTFEGAGGIGGLLYRAHVYSTLSEGAYYTYDGNGNVSELVSTNGDIAAHYEYDPFGNLTDEQGTLATSNSFRFSSKYWDEDTKLAYYGYRYYHPDEGRWLSRDPIGEEGGENLYGFVGNDSLGRVDALGHEWLIDRINGLYLATARAYSRSDTFDDLAQLLNLDKTDYQKWAHTSDSQAKVCQKYLIPNTIYMQTGSRKWDDYLPTSIIAIWRRLASGDQRDYESQGFTVVWQDNVTDEQITGALGTDHIYGYLFIGHGSGDGVINTFGAGEGVMPDRYSQYGIASLALKACGSADGSANDNAAAANGLANYNMWEWNVAKRGWFIGYEGGVNALNELFRWRIAHGRNRTGIKQ